MQISEKRLAANRSNALKSTGPRTAKGKASSSRNAMRHAILSNSLLIEGESHEKFLAMIVGLEDEFRPESYFENSLIEIMAAAQWRLYRIWALQSSEITHRILMQSAPQINENPPTRTVLAMRDLADSGRNHELLSRYETRFDRQYHRAAQRLAEVREARNRGEKMRVRNEAISPAAIPPETKDGPVE